MNKTWSVFLQKQKIQENCHSNKTMFTVFILRGQKHHGRMEIKKTILQVNVEFYNKWKDPKLEGASSSCVPPPNRKWGEVRFPAGRIPSNLYTKIFNPWIYIMPTCSWKLNKRKNQLCYVWGHICLLPKNIPSTPTHNISWLRHSCS